ncbi:MAG: large conductance mechanosensitive channel protein MscL [Clostridia bacterium]|nr:large conductance mechanosensitive channel protein MscL [Clostridia bacterium]
MKKFFEEFKKFITRGNVLDMAVGVIVGGAFTAIVNGVSNFVLKPIINWFLALILGKNALSELFTFLTKATMLDEAGNEVVDLANSIYIDWGSLINAIINFLITALVLFLIVRTINRIKEENAEAKGKRLSKEVKNELKANGISLRDKEAVKAYLDAKAEKEAEAKAQEEAAAAEDARLEREANPTAEDLLKKIVTLLENK